MRIETIRKITLAGPFDAIAVLLIAISIVLTSPFFHYHESYRRLLIITFSGIGAWWIFNERLMFLLREKFLLKSKYLIKSSELVIAEHDKTAQQNALLFGYTADEGKPVYISYDFLMRHVWILGQSGVGKTVLGTNLMFQQIVKGGGLLFIDGKMNGDDLQTMYQICKWAGREQDLLVINPGKPELSNSYNPILYGDADEVASRLLSLIPSSEDSPGADFYRQSTKQAITTLIAALQETGLAYNFMDLSILLLNGKALLYVESLLVRDKTDSPITNQYRLFLDRYKTVSNKGVTTIDVDRLKDILGGMAGRLYDFGTGTFGEVLNTYTPDVNLFEAIRANKVIYVMLPTMGKNEQAQNFGKMVIGDLRTALSWVQALPEAQRPNPPFMVFADEAGSYVSQSWPRMFEQARSARIWLMPATQTQANFEAISKELEQMIIGNTWTKVFFKIGTPESAETAANIIGMERKASLTIAENTGRSESGQEIDSSPIKQAGDSAGITISQREEEVYRVHPDQLASLDMGQCIVSFGGDKLYNIRVPMLTLTPEFREQCGKAQLNYFDHQARKGLDLFKNINRWLSDVIKNDKVDEQG